MERTLLAILVCLLVATSAKDLVLGERTQSSLKPSTADEYSLKLSIIEKNQDLFILTEALNNDPDQIPIVIVRRGNDAWYCSKTKQTELCLIEGSLLKDNDQLSISVSCITDCNYALEVYMSTEYQVEMGKQIKAQLQNNSFGLVMVLYPPEFVDYSQIVIVATLDNPDTVQKSFYLYANVGQNISAPTGGKFQFEGQQIWDDGLGIFLNSTQVNKNDTIKITIEAPALSVLTFQSYWLVGNSRDIKLGENIRSNVNEGSEKLFLLDLSKVPSLQQRSAFVKIIKYTGIPEILVSTVTTFQPNNTLELYTYDGISQVGVTPAIRQKLNFTGTLYIKIKGKGSSSTFTLTTFTDVMQYIRLKPGVTEVFEQLNNTVDNFLFEQFYPVNLTNPIKRYTMYIQNVQKKLTFGVRRCQSLEVNKTLTCLVPTPQEFTKQSKSFADILGMVEQSGTSFYFTFDYPIDSCIRLDTDIPVYHCVFQIVVVNEDPDFKMYTILFQEAQTVKTLLQGVAARDRIELSEYKYYKFNVDNIQNVKSLHFYVTSISGKVLLLSSNQSYPKLNSNTTNGNGVSLTTIDLKQNITNVTYLSVFGVETSLYTVTAVVKRIQQEDTVISLTEGYSSMYTINQQNGQLKFHLTLHSAVSFRLDVSVLEGALIYNVYPAKNKAIINEQTKWLGQSASTIIDNEFNMYSDTLEFIIVVNSYKVNKTVFNILYRLQGVCTTYSLSMPLQISIIANEKYCTTFNLNRLQQLEIVLTTPSFVFGTQNFTITYDINSTKTKIINRVTKISKQQLTTLCPELTSRTRSNSCIMTLTFHNPAYPEQLTAVVQYINDYIYLYDGLMQYYRGLIYNSKSRHFYYELKGTNTITVVIYSKIDIDYEMVARLVDLNALNAANSTIVDVFPDYLTKSDPNTFSTITSPIGTTSIIIKTNQIVNSKCTACVLLIALYSIQQSAEAEFRIEVVQQFVNRKVGQTSEGFVEKQSVQRYSIETNQNQILVTLDTLSRYCAYLNLFEQIHNEDTIQTQSFEGHITIPGTPTNKTKYIVEVVGISSCQYAVSFSSVKQSLLEIRNARPIKIQLEANQSFYFLYFNYINQSFRVISLLQYGDIQFYAEALSVQQLEDIETYIASEENSTQFQGKQIGTLDIEKESKDFCNYCYFLIQAKATQKSSTGILLHYIDSPIPIQDGVHIRDRIIPNQSITYYFETGTTFNLTLQNLYGNYQVTVVRSDNVTLVNSSLSQQKNFFVIPHFQDETLKNPKGLIGYYIGIHGTANKAGYVLFVQCHGSSARIRRGIPFDYTIKKQQKTCLEFISHEAKTNQTLYIQTQEADQLNVTFECQSQSINQTCANETLVISRESSESNIIYELKSLKGTYFICLSSKVETNLSLMIAGTELKHLTMNSQLLNRLNYSKVDVFEIYSPVDSSIMIEAYECRGEVDVLASNSYDLLLANKSELIFEHTKTAGHYVGKADVKQGLYFYSTRPRRIKQNQSSLYLTKYSFYEKDQFPYKEFEMEEEGIQYVIENNQMIFTVKKVDQLGGKFNILTIKYTIFITNCHMMLTAATQCSSGSVYNMTKVFGESIDNVTSTIQFAVQIATLEKIVNNSEYFYVGVVCTIEVVPKLSHHSDQYRFVYNAIEITKIAPAQIPYTAFTYFMWVVLPIIVGLIVFILAIRFCVRKVYYLPDNNLNEEVELKEVSSKSENMAGGSGIVSGVVQNNPKQQV